MAVALMMTDSKEESIHMKEPQFPTKLRTDSFDEDKPFFQLIKGTDDAGHVSLGCAICCMWIGFLIFVADVIASQTWYSPGAIIGYFIIVIALIHIIIASYCYQRIQLKLVENSKHEEYIKMTTTHCLAIPYLFDCCTKHKYGSIINDNNIENQINISVNYKTRVYCDIGIGNAIFIDKCEDEKRAEKVAIKIEKHINGAIEQNKTYTYVTDTGMHDDVHYCCYNNLEDENVEL
eukprot:198343_1